MRAPSLNLKVGVWALACVGLTAAAVSDARGWRRYARLRAEVDDLTAHNKVAARENRRLQREARALKDNPAAISRAARVELGLIRPGELILQLKPELTATPRSSPPSAEK